MNEDVQIIIGGDTATPELTALAQSLQVDRIRRAVATSCVQLTKDYLNNLPPNRRGWPSTGFYHGAALGTTWESTPEGIAILIDNENAPGAMKFRFHGGTISMKDKLLTIPARAEFYGHRAGEFSNLRFVMFKSGAKALVIGTGGTDRLNAMTWKTGRGTRTGTGARTAMMIAYWLVESVTQDGNPDVVPSQDAYKETAIQAVVELIASRHSNN